MTDICFYFQVHQPKRIKWWNPGEKGYFDEWKNKHIFERVARKCYYPATKLLLDHVKTFKGQDREFKIAYSLSGTFLEQCEKYEPELLDLFQQMADSGNVEFLSETYYHSLTSLFEDDDEFKEQVRMHQGKMKDLFGVKTKTFRNTELIYNNRVARLAEDLGFKAILTEGTERILEWRSPNYVYEPETTKGKIKLLLRNYKLSDDVAFRFSARWWNEFPLSAEKYAYWLGNTTGDCINLFMDYESFGEHHWEDTGIFWFLKALPWKVFDHQHLNFTTPSELAKKPSVSKLDAFEMGKTISWADLERDESAWLGNRMQQIAFQELKNLRHLPMTEDQKDTWRNLLTSDQIYYLCTKGFGDGNVHSYFSPYYNPYDAYANLMAVINDFKSQVLLSNAMEKVKMAKGIKVKKKSKSKA